MRHFLCCCVFVILLLQLLPSTLSGVHQERDPIDDITHDMESYALREYPRRGFRAYQRQKLSRARGTPGGKGKLYHPDSTQHSVVSYIPMFPPIMGYGLE